MISRLTSSDSVLLVVDIQEKLLAKMPTAQALVRDAAFLIDVARLLDLPLVVTEQYPKGLGPTVATLSDKLPAKVLTKTCFSCCGADGFLDEFKKLGRPNIVLTGMETHVCIAQTALDLRQLGYSVFIPVDGVASRSQLDHDTALTRLAAAGVTLTTCEAIAFEWTGDAARPQFKAISRLVIERSTSSASP